MAIETAFAAVGTWLINKYGKEAIDGTITEIQDRLKQFWWKGAAEGYEASLCRQHATIRILGKPEPVPLEGIYTDIFILDKPTALFRYNIRTPEYDDINRFKPDNYRKRNNGLEMVKQGKNLFILGKPDAGKTTFMRHVTIQALEGNLDKVPIFITLKYITDAVIPELVKQFDMCGFPDAEPFIEQLLKDGKAIVLFDGLDEVNLDKNQRAGLTQQLNDFSQKYPDCQVLITCRIAATEYHFEGFQDVEVADFTRYQIDKAVIKWFVGNEKKKDAFFEDFGKKENQGLRDLASRPLLLSLLCLAFEDSMTFPRRRADLYEEALDALLRKWDSSRNIQRDDIYRNLSTKLKHRMFAHIAVTTFEENEYFFAQRELEKHIENYLSNLPIEDRNIEIDGGKILKAIIAQHGVFVERAMRIHSFAHLSFQEYYTSKYIADNWHKDTVKDLITNYFIDERWREIFLLTASLLDEADEFFTLFGQTIDRMVVDNDQVIKLLQWINREATSVDNTYKQSIIRAVCLFRTFARALAIRDSSPALNSGIDFTLVHRYALDIAQFLSRGHEGSFNYDIVVTLDPSYALNLDNEQLGLLIKYLNANKLLVECLNLAYVSNRQEIEDSLLLPPTTEAE